MENRFKVISVYNRYLNRGGEDEVFEDEASLLERYGSESTLMTADVYYPRDFLDKLKVTINAVWSKDWHIKFQSILEAESPDLTHVHNFFPNISPSIYYASNQKNVPVVQTLHNYRLLCPAATFYRNHQVCELCLSKYFPYPGVYYRCYHDSSLQTAVIGAMVSFHRLLKTWQQQIDAYIAVSNFVKEKFVKGGFPADKIFVKQNFVYPDPGVKEGKGTHVLSVGRLSKEKGVIGLLKAWEKLNEIPLMVAGDGPLFPILKSSIESKGLNHISLLGRITRDKIISLLKQSRFLVFPSEWFETFGLVAAEAFACGVPVIASRLGAMEEIVDDGRTGLHFNPGDPDDLAAKVQWAWDHPQQMAEMGKEARREYELKYTAERNYEMLMEIYQRAIENNRNKK